ncbi:hypothetical protein GCM10025795_19440 [Verticiella sediminum]
MRLDFLFDIRQRDGQFNTALQAGQCFNHRLHAKTYMNVWNGTARALRGIGNGMAPERLRLGGWHAKASDEDRMAHEPARPGERPPDND